MIAKKKTVADNLFITVNTKTKQKQKKSNRSFRKLPYDCMELETETPNKADFID